MQAGRKKEKKLASLDEIVADVKQQKQRYQEQQQQQSTITPEISCPNHYSTPHSSSAAHSAHTAQWSVPGLHHHNSTGTAAPKPAAVAVPNFTFDDDSDLEFPSRCSSFAHNTFHTACVILQVQVPTCVIITSAYILLCVNFLFLIVMEI